MSWYCAIKLKQIVHLAVASISRQLRDFKFDPADWQPRQVDEAEEFHCSVTPDTQALPKLSEQTEVDDWYASFEWGSGGIVHVHVVLWVKGAPRIDAVLRPDEQGNLPALNSEDVKSGDVVVLDEDVAHIMASFSDGVYTEWNTRKAEDGSQADRLGERERRRRDRTERSVRDPCSTPWQELENFCRPKMRRQRRLA